MIVEQNSDKEMYNEIFTYHIYLYFRPPSLPPKPKKRRIGRNPQVGQPKLFGGNLEEYIEVILHLE